MKYKQFRLCLLSFGGPKLAREESPVTPTDLGLYFEFLSFFYCVNIAFLFSTCYALHVFYHTRITATRNKCMYIFA